MTPHRMIPVDAIKGQTLDNILLIAREYSIEAIPTDDMREAWLTPPTAAKPLGYCWDENPGSSSGARRVLIADYPEAT